jgi:hypothetical protein
VIERTREAPSVAGGAASARLAGRRAHHAMTSARKTSGAAMSAALSPTAAREIAAAVRSKKKPAYAHSFNRGTPGTTVTIAPRSFHAPSNVRSPF